MNYLWAHNAPDQIRIGGCERLKCSSITRYSRDVKEVGDKEIELFVGSSRAVRLLWWE
jgi:hypothetical protein